jgi:hypothetical protein
LARSSPSVGQFARRKDWNSVCERRQSFWVKEWFSRRPSLNEIRSHLKWCLLNWIRQKCERKRNPASGVASSNLPLIAKRISKTRLWRSFSPEKVEIAVKFSGTDSSCFPQFLGCPVLGLFESFPPFKREFLDRFRFIVSFEWPDRRNIPASRLQFGFHRSLYIIIQCEPLKPSCIFKYIGALHRKWKNRIRIPTSLWKVHWKYDPYFDELSISIEFCFELNWNCSNEIRSSGPQLQLPHNIPSLSCETRTLCHNSPSLRWNRPQQGKPPLRVLRPLALTKHGRDHS